MARAAASGRFKVVKWLHDQVKKPSSFDVLREAIGNGHLQFAEYLLDLGYRSSMYIDLTERVTEEQHFRTLEWIQRVQSSLQRNVGCMDYSARMGRLRVVQWLHVNSGYSCTDGAMGMAAANGHLEVVKWLHANTVAGCTEDAMDLTARYGHLHVVSWLHYHRFEGCALRAMDEAAENGHLEILT